jgi:hypothetical protein
VRGIRARPLVDRIVDRLVIADCWEDSAKPDADGRTRIQWRGEDGVRRGQPTYRALYGLLVRPLGSEEHLHHMCLNIICCNPDHLLPCSQAENNRFDKWKTPSAGAANRAKTHCVNGHEFSPENTYVYTYRRTCKTCVANHKKRSA